MQQKITWNWFQDPNDNKIKLGRARERAQKVGGHDFRGFTINTAWFPKEHQQQRKTTDSALTGVQKQTKRMLKFLFYNGVGEEECSKNWSKDPEFELPYCQGVVEAPNHYHISNSGPQAPKHYLGDPKIIINK